ncbi:MAG: hypothetical protein K0Q68_610 [Moraxellaceae bacterium]|jgi:Spy/CpxP family protein refolding chaperone|nr:hypothetical protein [Moraxellaceae bacterium]
MKAAYIVIFASMLAFPLTFALADRFGSRPCPPGTPCLPGEIELTPQQQRALQGIYEKNRRQQEELQRQTRRAVLNLLTPAQLQRVRARDLQQSDAAAAPQVQR